MQTPDLASLSRPLPALLLVFFTIARARSETAPPPAQPAAPPYACRLEARLERLDADHYYIPVRCTTTVPDGAIIDLEAYYVKPASEIFRRPNRPPPPPDLYLLDSSDRRIENGRCEAKLWILRRAAPYPGRYRVRASLAWSKQPAPLRGDQPETRDPLEWPVEWTWGTDEDLTRERSTAGREVRQDLDRLASLRLELSKRLRAELQSPPETQAWASWLESYRSRLAPLTIRNERRHENGIFWRETQGKYRIQDLTERLDELAQFGTEAVKARAPSVPPRIEEREKAFESIFQNAMDLLGYAQPIDPKIASDALEPIREDLNRIEKMAAALRSGRPGPTSADIEAMRVTTAGHLSAGFISLCEAAPKQTAEPLTAATEAITAFFTDAASTALGIDKSVDAERHYRVAAAHIQRLRDMLTSE
jgi:hypothetical protein